MSLSLKDKNKLIDELIKKDEDADIKNYIKEINEIESEISAILSSE